ncbi:uncharacterized protein LOC115959492 isoform X1 [Quercus lobata]|uniref:uncharacterized protein LOC115959492 isoform X1 n=1 Tax=Quercus lobata TaxID=97700 RepID=UPI001248AD3D|nr:uncharacterized protein LOC115959492 isoform X1 [Quercus lobata]XP_030933769.1 uncharacterized protein LOC115959492 isoform X1 [Quercus lobata]
MGNVRVKGEDGDDECDLRLMRRWKRRCIANGSFNAKVCDNSAKKTRNNSVKLEATPLYDKDYVHYVNYLLENDYDSDNGTDFNGKSVLDGYDKVKILENDDQDAGFWHNMCLDDNDLDGDNDTGVNARYVLDGHDNVKISENNDQEADFQHKMCLDDNDDVWDPQYKMFMENLRHDGKSYVLVVVNNEIPVVVRYEREEGLCDGLKLDTHETLKSCLRGVNTKTARAVKREKIESLNNLGNVSGVKRSGKTEAVRTLNDASRYEREEGLCDGLKLDTSETLKSCLRGVNTKTARSLKKEKFESLNNLNNVLSVERSGMAETGRTLNDASRREKIESPNVFFGVSSLEKTEKQITKMNFVRRESMETLETLRGVTRKKSKNLMMDVNEENEDPFSGGTNGHLSKRSGMANAKVLHPAKHDCNHRVESDMIDECYKIFLNCLESNGGNLVFKPEHGKPVTYEGDVESSDDLEIYATDKDPFSDRICSPFVASRSDAIVNVDIDRRTRIGSPGSGRHSQFRKNLMEILRRPYNEMEYKKLMHEVAYRRPKERDRELRSGTKSYSTKSCGKSYLDQYSGFKRKIKSVQSDRHRVFNLLRGFFFWLQNLSHEGAFQPWKDKPCLGVLPQK